MSHQHQSHKRHTKKAGDIRFRKIHSRSNNFRSQSGTLRQSKESNRRNKHLKNQKGQSLVEMSIGLIIPLFIVLGLLDLGRLFYSYSALQNAASAGAVYASAFPSCQTAAQCPDPNNVEYVVKNESPDGIVNWDSNLVITSFSPDMSLGSEFSVTVTYNFELYTPFIQDIAGSTLSLQSTAAQPVIGEP